MKKILIAIIIVLVLGLGYWAMVKKPKDVSKQPETNQTQKPANNTGAEVAQPEFKYEEPTKAPAGFPSSIPLEEKAEITQNFSAVTPEGKQTSVREFASKFSVKENAEYYKKYLSDSGYVVEPPISDSTQTIVSGTKDGYRLRVRIYTETEKVKVTLNYIQI